MTTTIDIKNNKPTKKNPLNHATRNITPELYAQLPRDDQGNVLSVGSLAHLKNQCSPCLFYLKGTCKNGVSCMFCHFDHGNKSTLPSSPNSPWGGTRQLENNSPAGTVPSSPPNGYLQGNHNSSNSSGKGASTSANTPAANSNNNDYSIYELLMQQINSIPSYIPTPPPPPPIASPISPIHSPVPSPSSTCSSTCSLPEDFNTPSKSKNTSLFQNIPSGQSTHPSIAPEVTSLSLSSTTAPSAPGHTKHQHNCCCRHGVASKGCSGGGSWRQVFSPISSPSPAVLPFSESTTTTNSNNNSYSLQQQFSNYVNNSFSPPATTSPNSANDYHQIFSNNNDRFFSFNSNDLYYPAENEFPNHFFINGPPGF